MYYPFTVMRCYGIEPGHYHNEFRMVNINGTSMCCLESLKINSAAILPIFLKSVDLAIDIAKQL